MEAPAYRMYRCRRCENTWVGNDSKGMRRCVDCGASNPFVSAAMPQEVALDMLQRKQIVGPVADVARAVEASSARLWLENPRRKLEVFNKQVSLLNAIYDAMLRGDDVWKS
jgi:hypothetical protein